MSSRASFMGLHFGWVLDLPFVSAVFALFPLFPLIRQSSCPGLSFLGGGGSFCALLIFLILHHKSVLGVKNVEKSFGSPFLSLLFLTHFFFNSKD